MPIHPSVKKLLLNIMKTFPDVAIHMLRLARTHRSIALCTTEMVGEFARLTTQAMRDGNQAVVQSHLKFMSGLLRVADEKTREYIDVYYVEELFFGLTLKQKKTAWSWLPANLKQLYVAMWGELE
ncbi:hypothetical protein DFR42_102132 [Undibacterium pigrum]|uniref:DUF7674 domain-containing protein n=2 Tax=Undibacterium pigrum TaxID=401470 RepID=A0A318JD95_9BURK|nr:hypothetical protein DFR42_102132 [Undibacterium pigrum]